MVKNNNDNVVDYVKNEKNKVKKGICQFDIVYCCVQKM